MTDEPEPLDPEEASKHLRNKGQDVGKSWKMKISRFGLRIFCIITMLAAVIGFGALFAGMAGAESAIQEAAIAAAAAAFVIIPYIFTKCAWIMYEIE